MEGNTETIPINLIVMDNIENKWRLTGLLEGNDGYDAMQLANNLEDCAEFLIENSDDTDIKLKAGVLLPIVVILFNEENVKIIDMDRLYFEFSEYFDKVRFFMENDEPGLCRDFVKQFAI